MLFSTLLLDENQGTRCLAGSYNGSQCLLVLFARSGTGISVFSGWD